MSATHRKNATTDIDIGGGVLPIFLYPLISRKMYLEYTPLTQLLLPYFLVSVYFCLAMWLISPTTGKWEKSQSPLSDRELSCDLRPEMICSILDENLPAREDPASPDRTPVKPKVVTGTKARSKSTKVATPRRSTSSRAQTKTTNLEAA